MTKPGNEPWAAWAESMQKMMSNPGAMNPFAGMMGAGGFPGMPGMPGAASAAGGAAGAFDPQQFLKAIDPVEIERRIQDMRAVESWMKLTLSGLEMSIKTMEMQRDAYASFAHMRESAQESATAAMEGVKRAAESVGAAARPATKKRASGRKR